MAASKRRIQTERGQIAHRNSGRACARPYLGYTRVVADSSAWTAVRGSEFCASGCFRIGYPLNAKRKWQGVYSSNHYATHRRRRTNRGFGRYVAKMTIASNSVTRKTVAGGVFISQQDLDFTDPSALEAILRDLAGEYMIKTDDIAADALVNAASASGATWTVTANDPTSLISGLYEAAKDIQVATNYTPTHLFASPDVWQKMGAQLDADKRPVFGYTSGASLIGTNTIGSARELSYLGTNVMGLQLVVDNNFASGTLLVVRAEGFECYENVRGIMTKEDPELLGRNFTYYGYFATFATDADMIKYIVVS